MDKDSSIGRYLSYIYRAGHCYIGKRLEEFNIGSGQYGLLLLLSKNDGISQESLSDINKLDKATVGRAIKKLENQGYVVRKQDELDKRAYKLYITPKGEKVVPEIRKILSDWLDIVLGGFSDQEKDTLIKLLGKVFGNLCNYKS